MSGATEKRLALLLSGDRKVKFSGCHSNPCLGLTESKTDPIHYDWEGQSNSCQELHLPSCVCGRVKNQLVGISKPLKVAVEV